MTNHCARNCPWLVRTVPILSVALIASVMTTPVRSVTLGKEGTNCDQAKVESLNQHVRNANTKERPFQQRFMVKKLDQFTDVCENVLKGKSSILNESARGTRKNWHCSCERRATKRFGRSMAFAVPLSYLTPEKQLETQGLNRRVYEQFTPGNLQDGIKKQYVQKGVLIERKNRAGLLDGRQLFVNHTGETWVRQYNDGEGIGVWERLVPRK